MDDHGHLHGVEAVIDKDLAAALLALQLDADALLMLTDVDAVYEGWGTDAQQPLRDVSTDELQAMAFAEGSMAPKGRAATQFATACGRPAAIGALRDAARILEGSAGTWVRPTSTLAAAG
jgi:carbamate kinase